VKVCERYIKKIFCLDIPDLLGGVTSLLGGVLGKRSEDGRKIPGISSNVHY